MKKKLDGNFFFVKQMCAGDHGLACKPMEADFHEQNAIGKIDEPAIFS